MTESSATPAGRPAGAAGEAHQPVAPLGEQYELAAGELRAHVVEVGAALRALSLADRPLIYGFGPNAVPSGAHGQLLTPWPNRVDAGRYTFGGHEQQLDISEPARNTALHGLARWARWVPAEREPHRLLLTHRLHTHPGYPHVLDLSVEYLLDAGSGLTVRMSATNVGATPAPYGHGAHPYLTVGTPRIDDCLLHIPGSCWLPTDERGIPVGVKDVAGTPYDFRRPRPVGDTAIDYAFTELDRDAAGRARITLAMPGGAAVSLWVDETFAWMEVFTGDTLPDPDRRTGLGVEPMSCPPNGFVTGEGVITLEPGATTTGSWGIEPS